MKYVSLLVLKLQPVGHTLGLAPTELLSKNIGCEYHLGALSLPCSSLLVAPRKELMPLSRILIFATATQEMLRSPDSGGQLGLHL